MNSDPHTQTHMITHICYDARDLSLSEEFAACVREKRKNSVSKSVCAVERDGKRFPGNDWAEVSRLNE